MHDPYPLSLVCYTLSNLLSTAIFLGLASFVYLRGRTRLLNRLFALWCISVSVWAFGVFNQSLASDPDAALRWSQLLHVAAACIPILFLHFILCYLHAKRMLVVVLYVVASGFVLAAIDSHRWLIRDVAPIGVFQFYPKAGPLYPAFLTYFSTCLFIAFFGLWREYHGSSAIRRNQIRYLLVATVLGFAGGTTTFFYVYDIPIFPYGNYGLVTVCAAMIAYAIVKHRLINTSEVLHKGLTYSLLLPLIFAPTYVVVLLLIRVKTGTIDYVLAGMVLTAFMLCAATLEMFHKRLETAVAKTMFKRQYKAYETLTGFSQSMVRVLDLTALTDEIVRTVARAMDTPVASLYLWEKESQLYRCVAFSGAEASPSRKETIHVEEAVSHSLITTRIILVREELALGGDRLGQPMLDVMDGMGAEVCIPLINKERVIGFCNLGCRPARQMYSPADLDLLTTLGQNAAIAVDNARLYEDLRQLYEDLQQSQRLVLRTDRLRSLEIMAAGFAHEVRNPLTS
ncbi:MAG: histidine kinase N-terminal 7TM domain-containing protein, partial [Nitrospirales bacterium]